MNHECDKCQKFTKCIYFYRPNLDYETALLCPTCLKMTDRTYFTTLARSFVELGEWKAKSKISARSRVEMNQDFSTGTIDLILK